MTDERTELQRDHDALIRIETLMREFMQKLDKHIESYGKEAMNIKRSIDAAHRRIDWMVTGGLISIIAFFASITTFFLKFGK